MIEKASLTGEPEIIKFKLMLLDNINEIVVLYFTPRNHTLLHNTCHLRTHPYPLTADDLQQC